MQKKINTLLFDLGVVLLDVDYQLSYTILKENGFEEIEKHIETLNLKKTFQLFETGVLTPTKFYESFCKEFNHEMPYNQFEAMWNAMLKTIPPERIQLLRRLAGQYPVYLLSNTNQIHENCFKKQSYWPVNVFSKEFYSHHIGLRKPMPEIFQHVIQTTQLRPESTLFIDDLEVNCNSAKELGFQTWHLKPTEQTQNLRVLLDIV